MSRLRRAWEARSVGTFSSVGGGALIPQDIPAGYGQAGFGSWSTGMNWSSGAGNGTPESAMRLSAVYACWRLLSEAVATLPLDVYTKRPGGLREEVLDRPRYLTFMPPMGDLIDYLSQIMLSLLTDGNVFIATPRDEFGVPLALIVLDPKKVEVGTRDGVPCYLVGGNQYGWMDIMHLSGMKLAGTLRGVSPLAAARDVIDGGRKAQDFGSAFIGNHAMPPGVIEMPDDPLDPQARERAKLMAEAWHQSHGGSANSGKVGVLLGGATLKTIALSPEDAQWLESKRFGVSEIARFYGVPPHLIADASNSTSWGSGLAEQNLAFGQFSLRPWIERIEKAHNRLLFTHGMGDAFVKLNLDALLRASLRDRYESYKIGIESGFLDPDEARRFEDLPPLTPSPVEVSQ